MNTKMVNTFDLTVGTLVHFAGAVFEIVDYQKDDKVARAKGVWKSGNKTSGCHSLENWTFQGNELAYWKVQA